MNDFDIDTLRITLHLLAACVWVGGQIVLAALVPVLREIGDDAPRKAANRFGRVAWPFFALAVITGVWNLLEIDVGDRSTAYHVTLAVKLLVVAAAGTASAVHSLTPSPAIRGITGAVGLFGSLAALVFGVMLVWG
ncbi:MAG: CopD family protein [Acidimicrobiales bacterium]|nr:CopD family protein [Acidimicrobiales bacterium]